MKRVAFIFPGQGSQHTGMGAALAKAIPESRAVFEEADEALGFPLSAMCFDGTEEDLALTENTQPAVLAASIAALRALEARGVRPLATAGHSLGEYSAHVAAGTIGFADALRTVRARGRFMQEAVPVGVGAMAAILGLARSDVERVCDEQRGEEILAAANLNGPKQTVIAGHAVAVARAIEGARAAGARRALALRVSAPFHCALMDPAARRLSDILATVPLRDPAVPVYTNVDAAPVAAARESRDALVRQVSSPVRWHEVVQAMIDDGFDTFVEVGPGRVLSGLVRAVDRGVNILAAADPEGVERVVEDLGRGGRA